MLVVSKVCQDDIIFKKYSKEMSLFQDDFYVLKLEKEHNIIATLACRIDDIYLKILDITLDNSNIIYLDFFIRSLCAFAQNRNLFTLKCDNKNLYGYLKPFCTLIQDNIFYIDTIKLTSSCSCSNSKTNK